jgi:excisionase family DNA binding protein
MLSEWITTAEAAKLSGYHPEYIRWLIRNGDIGAKKFGIVWQVNKQSLLNYLAAAKRSSDKRRGSKISKT